MRSGHLVVSEAKVFQRVVVGFDALSQINQPRILFEMSVAQQESSIQLDYLIDGQLVLCCRPVQTTCSSNNLQQQDISAIACLWTAHILTISVS